MAKIAERAESLEEVQLFEALGGGANVMRSCELGLRLVASGTRCRGDFCELTGRQHPPSSEEAVLGWPAYLSAGRTSQQCLPHLEKPGIISGYSLEWKSNAVVQAARGLAKAGDRIRGPEPAAELSLSAKVAGGNPSPDAFAWAFLPRVQSEGLLLVRRMPRGQTGGDSVLESPPETEAGKGHLVIRLHRRKHLAGGSRAVRR